MKTLPTRDHVRGRLVGLLNEIAGIPVERITEGATVEEDLQMQSVVFVELQVAMEEEFDILIDPLRVVELNEFSALVDYLYECTAAQHQGGDSARKQAFS